MQLFERRLITRKWLCDFIWSYRQIQQELDRFLLDEHNVIWHPEQVFLDLDNRVFSFMYIPYYEQDNGFGKLVDFWVEHIDYEDEALVEFVYGLHGQYDTVGDACLNKQIFESYKEVEKRERKRQNIPVIEPAAEQNSSVPTMTEMEAQQDVIDGRKGLFSFLGGRRKKQDTLSYQEVLQRQVSMQTLSAVSEEVFPRMPHW